MLHRNTIYSCLAEANCRVRGKWCYLEHWCCSNYFPKASGNAVCWKYSPNQVQRRFGFGLALHVLTIDNHRSSPLVNDVYYHDTMWALQEYAWYEPVIHSSQVVNTIWLVQLKGDLGTHQFPPKQRGFVICWKTEMQQGKTSSVKNCEEQIYMLPNSSPLDKMSDISQTIFYDTFLWMKSFVFWLKFHWSLFLKVQFTTTRRRWFR